MELGLAGKRVLITGASQGIGAAIAEQFLREGAQVFIVSRGSPSLYDTESRLKQAYGDDKVFAASCDCSEQQSLEQLERQILQHWDGIDVVVANVGDGQSVNDPLPDADQWSSTWQSNFEPAVQTARVFLPKLQASKGCLLFISSIAGMEAFGAPVDYSTAKAAVLALAKNMARKLAQVVRVNVLAPGNVFFPGGSWDKKIATDPQRIEGLIASTVPMNRFGTPQEVANAAVFLCSECASFITGSVLVVDGGQTVGV